jgi:hypothetical protein
MDGIAYAQGWNYYMRVVYDLLFFVVVGVLLFNMVTGIILDTFADQVGR